MTGYDPLFLNHKTVLKASETLETLENLHKTAFVISKNDDLRSSPPETPQDAPRANAEALHTSNPRFRVEEV